MSLAFGDGEGNKFIDGRPKTASIVDKSGNLVQGNPLILCMHRTFEFHKLHPIYRILIIILLLPPPN